VLFSDIRSFTSISEKMEPEAVVGFLNDYMQRMVETVFEEGGIVDKFIGDAVMAVFGAPVVHPDDATRAVRCAIRMMEELENFNADQAKKGGVNINIGVGLHTGALIAGNIGSDRKMEYTVIGDTVNIASRVQDLNKEFKTNIIITEACYNATGRSFPVRGLRPYKVKGKEQEVMIYEVLRQPKPQQAAPAAPSVGADTGAIGLQTFDIEL
jgi:adenylate cyclase